jgi:hypothetical protein
MRPGMKRTLVRAAACAAIASTLAGCVPLHLSPAGAAIMAMAVTGSVISSVAPPGPARRDRRPRRRYATAPSAPRSYPDEEIRLGITCERKRDEFLTVFQGSRPLPPQLHCGPNGEFGSPRVYGSGPRRGAGLAESEPSLALEEP